jgi:3-oxocholest-4-en-26-oyl-CoA dehydrogenase beta subunit
MDFRLERRAQRTLRDLAREILGDRATHERFKELEATGARCSTATCGGLSATPASSAPPSPRPTAGQVSPCSTCCRCSRRRAATSPRSRWSPRGRRSHAGRLRDDDLQATWLPRAAAGDAHRRARRRARRRSGDDHGAGGRRRRRLAADGGAAVRALRLAEADLVLVPAVVGDDVGLFAWNLVPASRRPSSASTNRQPRAHLEFAGAAAAVVAAPGAAGVAAVRLATERVTAAWCVVQAGVCEGAIRMLATHASNREQFGKRIAEFQAVAQRAADAFIDTQMVRLTAWQAMFRLAAGWDATKEVHVAKFWAGDGAMRAVHAAQHIHGGLGVDLDYPLHRYFLWAKQIEHNWAHRRGSWCAWVPPGRRASLSADRGRRHAVPTGGPVRVRGGQGARPRGARVRPAAAHLSRARGARNQLAHHLRAAGIGRGDHVGCHMPNGTEYVETMIACFKIGAVPINVNYRYVEEELRYLYDNADLKASSSTPSSPTRWSRSPRRSTRSSTSSSS